MSDTEKPSWEWRKETEALKQQLAAMTQERDWLRALYETDMGRQVPTKREGLP